MCLAVLFMSDAFILQKIWLCAKNVRLFTGTPFSVFLKSRRSTTGAR